ncbi:MAG: bifunctional diaminohydroxyphosphoribosylaminopyrimidine deaminase/5-amino-6-(5-phosphoribosylamino)uracil reductase RibD [Verrucomicrobiales bacterium]|nr:bifunctional diaminohydroxyphosphoribosylaminopyrimidine deaminase/5-amino-6-(5-phosphoribosylamino)uracil reductase RibD [Verrucomicrobiales bacterium]
MDDVRFMKEALQEGRKGLGKVSPNPPVGAVIVSKDGETILGRGWHQKAGSAHAEVEAIRNANEQNSSVPLNGTTIYVTLEPCSTEGRTPACTDAILEAGFGRVVIGTLDPNPAHAGAAIDILKAGNVEVETGVCEIECLDLIRFFGKHITTGMPWVIAKSAITLDGRTTLTPERGRWISCPESRKDVQRIRVECDAILVGGETVRLDNPHLTLRGEFAGDRKQPWRVVFTSSGDLPESSHLFTDEFSDRTKVIQGQDLSGALSGLGQMGITSVLLESGGRLFAHALAENLIDEVILYQAPIIGGGKNRLLPVDGIVKDLRDVSFSAIGRDQKIRGFL